MARARLDLNHLTPDGIASVIDHSVLQPTYTDEQMKQDLASVKHFPLASVCIKPYAVKLCVEALAGTGIPTCTVIGFPHGSALPAIKAAEAAQAFQDGAVEMDMVVNVGKVLSEDWTYVRADIKAVCDVTRQHKGIIKVIFETDFVTDDRLKIKLCEICSELGVDFVKTSTGFGYVKGADGKYSYKGATDHDLQLMKKHVKPGVGVKAAGGVRTLDDVLRILPYGVTRIGATATIAIMQAAVAKLGKGGATTAPAAKQPSATTSDY